MRYSNQDTFRNNHEQYQTLLEARDVSFIEQYGSIELRGYKFTNVGVVKHIWKMGDHYYKLAASYYGNPGQWWVIALFNKKPTENMLAYGDIVLIPKLPAGV